jgi:tetratricopeptide (TPR) repeat protein
VTSGEADYLCGVVYQRWQKPQQAYELYVSACDKAPGELAYVLAAGEMLVDMNRSDDALNMLRAKADSFEHSAEIRDAIGLLLTGKSRYAEAVTFLQQAAMLATDDQTIHEHLAMAEYFSKDYREAAEQLAKLLNDDRYKQRADLYLALGESKEQLGRVDDAKSAFETATQISPGSPEAWVSLGKVSLEKNDLRRAELALRKASSLDAASGEANLLLGYIRLRQNKPDEAMPYFKKASALNQSDTVSLCMVGYMHEKAGRTDEAIQCYARH